MARDHRRFASMERCQQCHDKQIAVLKAQCPAFTLLLLQVRYQQGNIVA
jgi:hypothetical protein